MRVGRIIYPVYTLGPGKRAVIWLSGCEKNCEGCANPELRDRNYGKEMNVKEITDIMTDFEKDGIDGFTISGGEPFLQKDELIPLISLLSEISEDILVFTGFEKNQLSADLSGIAVLIDGEYEEELYSGHILKGSANQQIHYLKIGYKELYEEYIRENSRQNFIQPVHYGDGMLFLGIQGMKSREALTRRLYDMGIEENKYE